MRASSLLVVGFVGLLGASSLLEGCNRHDNIRFLFQVDDDEHRKLISIRVAGKTLRPEDLKDNNYLDFPDGSVDPKTAPELLYDTPCGPRTKTLPNDETPNHGNVVVFRVGSRVLPPITRFILSPDMKGGVEIGSIKFPSPNPPYFDVMEAACSKELKIGGVAHPLPAIEPPDGGTSPGLAGLALLTDDPTACFLDTTYLYGEPPSPDSCKPQASKKLTGANVYSLEHDFDYLFVAPDRKIEVHGNKCQNQFGLSSGC